MKTEQLDPKIEQILQLVSELNHKQLYTLVLALTRYEALVAMRETEAEETTIHMGEDEE